MKKTKLLLTAVVVATAIVNSSAQVWSGGTVNTFTTSNVGIGTATYPADANLHIYNFGGTAGTGGIYASYATLPGIVIDDNHANAAGGFGFPASHEIFNITHKEYASDFASSPTSTNPLFLITGGLTGAAVGINNAIPTANLDVTGTGKFSGTLDVTGAGTFSGTLSGADFHSGDNIVMNVQNGANRNIFGYANKSYMAMLAGTHGGPAADGAYIQLYGNLSPSQGSISFYTAGPSTSKTEFIAIDPTSATIRNNVTIMNDGKVIIAGPGHNVGDYNIATSTPYGLYVGVGILTEKLKVALTGDATNWSDFVFNKNYKLRSLSDVEAYVKTNKHLPEIPSAKEVAEDGVDVVSMDAKLLQKIEELTLYVIQQQKEIDELKVQTKKN